MLIGEGATGILGGLEARAVLARLEDDLDQDTDDWDLAACMRRRLASPTARTMLAEKLHSLAADEAALPDVVATAMALLRKSIRDCAVIPILDADQLSGLVLHDQSRHHLDRPDPGTVPTGTQPITVADHSRALAARVRKCAEKVGLSPEMTAVLATAGRQAHDGRRDPRFQRMLGNTDPEHAWMATPHDRTLRQRIFDRTAAQLPRGWRPEQLSVVLGNDAPPGTDSDRHALVLRLIGTSRGHGRPDFMTTDVVEYDSGQRAAAQNWFLDGRWDALVEHTHHRWGLWGCAYLEALLRAADTHTTRELA